MSLINCKIHLELNWNNDCVMYGADTYAGDDDNNNNNNIIIMIIIIIIIIIEKQHFK